ncbi:recombinase RecT [Bradyrhizobium lablabi]|uniref:recombinase RecT n=1 Tax=Bradyrhizobium lablabi TaxID=722472 RepID=UPI001BA6B9B0|nr:recombinase RecT [Bradyrhizobium lablabi]MBR0693610.1 recombinase RecT [Bradyrhizobium lablabi]
MTDTDVAERQQNPIAVFKQQVMSREQEFGAVLPAHIPAERFSRVILTAVNKNPALLHADRASLFSSAMMAAADGLLCDGREAALVIYRTKKKTSEGDVWIDAVQYMPMVAGILKKVRNSGELSTIVAKVVYAGDRFRNWIDNEGEHLDYEAGESQERDIIRCAFAMAKLKDGSIEVEVLKPADIEKIRSVSRSKDKGPWVDWWEEMAKKSAIRRLSKRLPLNTDIDDLIRRDDALYDFDQARTDAQDRGHTSLVSKLDMLSLPAGSAPTIAHDPETGEVTEQTNSAASRPQSDATEAGSANPTPIADPATTSTQAAGQSAATGQAGSKSEPSKAKDKESAAATDKTAPPKNEQEYIAYATAWINSLDDADAGEKRWKDEKGVRNKAQVSGEAREALQESLKQKQFEIRDADQS